MPRHYGQSSHLDERGGAFVAPPIAVTLYMYAAGDLEFMSTLPDARLRYAIGWKV
ncbi:MAG: hypothetical protein IIC24_11930 [Chloroflexi bacterium]|nr:hypothetical protein [Chloroflexota bacterium]